MNYLDAGRATSDTDFVTRVKMAMVIAAIDVAAEPDETELHSARIATARVILLHQDEYALRFSMAVMSNSTLRASANFTGIPDGDLQFAINSVFNAFVE